MVGWGPSGVGAGTGLPIRILGIFLSGPPTTPATAYGYGNYGYGYGSFGYDYGYGYPSGSYYGSYYSGTTTEMTMKVLCAMFLAEYAVAWNRHDMAVFGRLFTETVTT